MPTRVATTHGDGPSGSVQRPKIAHHCVGIALVLQHLACRFAVVKSHPRSVEGGVMHVGDLDLRDLFRMRFKGGVHQFLEERALLINADAFGCSTLSMSN